MSILPCFAPKVNALQPLSWMVKVSDAGRFIPGESIEVGGRGYQSDLQASPPLLVLSEGREGGISTRAVPLSHTRRSASHRRRMQARLSPERVISFVRKTSR